MTTSGKSEAGGKFSWRVVRFSCEASYCSCHSFARTRSTRFGSFRIFTAMSGKHQHTKARGKGFSSDQYTFTVRFLHELPHQHAILTRIFFVPPCNTSPPYIQRFRLCPSMLACCVSGICYGFVGGGDMQVQLSFVDSLRCSAAPRFWYVGG